MYFRRVRTFYHDVLGRLTVYDNTRGVFMDECYFALKEIADMLLITDNDTIHTTCRNIIRVGFFTLYPEEFPEGYIIGRKDLHRLANVGDGKRAYLLRRWLQSLGIRRRTCWSDKSK